MIIKLPTADFSVNNIGSVELRTAVSPTTQAVLDYYGKTWTLQQQFAIEDFLLKKEAWSFKTKIKRLVLPILSQIEPSIAKFAQPKAFYDLISQAIVATTYGGSYTTSRQIVANGLIDTRLTTNVANDTLTVNFGTPTSWQNVHYGLYFHKTRNESLKIISSDGGTGFQVESGKSLLGFPNTITANFDPNSYTTKGLRLMSYDGTNITGLAANLPFASISGSGTISKTGDFAPYLLNRYNVTDDVTLSLMSFGDALTQPETVIYNNDIDILMNALWTV